LVYKNPHIYDRMGIFIFKIFFGKSKKPLDKLFRQAYNVYTLV